MRRASMGVAVAVLAACCACSTNQVPAAPAWQGAGPGPDGAAPPRVATAVDVRPDGAWSVTFAEPAWRFAGSLGAPAAPIASAEGHDAIGAYRETRFVAGAHDAAIRAYRDQPIVLFSDTSRSAVANGEPFPVISTYPDEPYHLSFRDVEFAPPSFTELTPDSPWLFFDDAANAFVLSPANHFMNAGTYVKDGAIRCGIADAAKQIPAGFEHGTILVAQPGIHAAFRTWGGALTALSGKTRPANDASVELAYLGYWTDRGGEYWYSFEPSLGYAGTLLALRDSFRALGVPLGYVQLDSWWYPKGPAQDWQAVSKGAYTYSADERVLPGGLAKLSGDLGLPLVTHARWIDPSSPYRAQYQMSANVSIDPAYWRMVASSLKAGGVVTYEQDWLDEMALPREDDLHDQAAFMDEMARAMGAQGVNLQYCMPLPRHHLQGSLYSNLLTVRVSGDRFKPSTWGNALHLSHLASALGAWPWVDVFMSTERENLLMATLSGGIVGVGDALGTTSAANLSLAARPDGLLVKPDAPIVPSDEAYLQDAKHDVGPRIAATYSDFGALFASYVVGYGAEDGARGSFTPATFGHAGPVVVYDFSGGDVTAVDAATPIPFSLAGGHRYFIVVPIGPSGLALLGDLGKFASLGKQRIKGWSDDGALHVQVAFAADEATVTLSGYAPRAPSADASGGGIDPITWDRASGLFTVVVHRRGEVSTVNLR